MRCMLARGWPMRNDTFPDIFPFPSLLMCHGGHFERFPLSLQDIMPDRQAGEFGGGVGLQFIFYL